MLYRLLPRVDRRELPVMASMRATRLVGFACAMCLGLMLGLALGGGALTLGIVLIGGGGALMVATCIAAEWK